MFFSQFFMSKKSCCKTKISICKFFPPSLSKHTFKSGFCVKPCTMFTSTRIASSSHQKWNLKPCVKSVLKKAAKAIQIELLYKDFEIKTTWREKKSTWNPAIFYVSGSATNTWWHPSHTSKEELVLVNLYRKGSPPKMVEIHGFQCKSWFWVKAGFSTVWGKNTAPWNRTIFLLLLN